MVTARSSRPRNPTPKSKSRASRNVEDTNELRELPFSIGWDLPLMVRPEPAP
jgi:hypothetical protein